MTTHTFLRSKLKLAVTGPLLKPSLQAGQCEADAEQPELRWDLGGVFKRSFSWTSGIMVILLLAVLKVLSGEVDERYRGFDRTTLLTSVFVCFPDLFQLIRHIY